MFEFKLMAFPLERVEVLADGKRKQRLSSARSR